ncbi:MAG: hypothetical protein ACOCRK_03770 [bacterium]
MKYRIKNYSMFQIPGKDYQKQIPYKIGDGGIIHISKSCKTTLVNH